MKDMAVPLIMILKNDSQLSAKCIYSIQIGKIIFNYLSASHKGDALRYKAQKLKNLSFHFRNLSELKETETKAGLLINFGKEKVEFSGFVY
ncbi:hypothetical protein JW998_05130 [candidate division KSB1 bacterium]|nr:hypothetical protein [candidate division KSB1 bacterium]